MSTLTKVKRCWALPALRALVSSVLPSLSWRHHGIGVLQAYLAEDTDPEVRIHIWDPRLIKPGIAESGSIHDHRFDMVSHVLCGVVGHEEHFATFDPDGDHRILTVTHARAAVATKYHGPVASEDGCYRVTVNRLLISEGSTYSFPAGVFHRSLVPGFAVTVVEKHCQRLVPARVLYPVALKPVMAFGHDADAELTAAIVARAADVLKSPL